jgi:hypothetical protein
MEISKLNALIPPVLFGDLVANKLSQITQQLLPHLQHAKVQKLAMRQSNAMQVMMLPVHPKPQLTCATLLKSIMVTANGKTKHQLLAKTQPTYNP